MSRKPRIRPCDYCGVMTPPTCRRVHMCAKCGQKLEVMAKKAADEFCKTDPAFQKYKKDVKTFADFIAKQ